VYNFGETGYHEWIDDYAAIINVPSDYSDGEIIVAFDKWATALSLMKANGGCS
jgi:hypothetical protein